MNRLIPTVLILCVSSAAATAEPPSVTLEFIMQGRWNSARIAESGQIVGIEGLADDQYAISRYSDGVGLERLYTDHFSAFHISNAFINSAGQVAYSVLTDEGAQSFLHTDGRPLESVDPGAGYSWIRGLTDTGVVYGGLGSSPSLGFSYDHTYSYASLGERVSTSISAMNETGMLALQYSPFASAGPSGVVRVSPDGESTDIGDFGGGLTQSAAMNNRGDIIGWTADTEDAARYFLYTDESGMQDLDLGTVHATLADINDQRWIVGELHSPAEGEPWPYPLLWTPETGRINMNSLLPMASGVTLHNATGINNSNQIVGYADFGNQWGIYRLTVHTLPTPGALAVFAFGVALVARRRR